MIKTNNFSIIKKKHFKRLMLTYFLLITVIFTNTSLFTKNNNNLQLTFNEQQVIIPNNQNIINNQNKARINKYISKYNNNEVKGIITIPNTNYEKAIMQHNDNDYYLNHLENKKAHYMGAIYLDFRNNINNDKKLLIYGHNSKNVSMPFKILEKYYQKEYYQEHQYIEIITPDKTRKYQIFSVYIETKDFDYMQTDYDNESTWFNHLTKLKNKSLYNTNIDITKNDNILILQTCSTHKNYQKYPKKYLLVIAKEVN